jgi:predicted aminopeptidase
LFLLLAALLALLPGCYVLQQGFGQLGMLSRREPIARVLQERDLPTRTRERLTLVWYARQYAIGRIGLRESDSYRDLVRLDRDAASYVVAAAPPDSLEPYRWCFPIAGCLPYIGYFDRRDAEREAARLRAQGYEVYVRGVEAYSLGGWMPDPLYSPMLDDSRGRLVNTVIHEMTHGTVFVPGRASFNEGLATFVGDRGALGFLEERFGQGSAVVAEARAELSDQRIYRAFLQGLIAELRAVYASPLPRAERLRRRDEVLARARARAATLPFQTALYQRVRTRTLNNAFLATHATYHGGEARFEAVYQRLGGDLRRFVAFMRDEVARQSDPERWLDGWLATHPRG